MNHRVVALAASLPLLYGCAVAPRASDLGIEPVPDNSAAAPPPGESGNGGHTPVELFVHVADTVADVSPELHVRLERLELSLLERETENSELRRKLDATHQDVVRIMARLQQVATRAEAASLLAEAEVATRALPATIPETADVKRLVTLSQTEFDRGNYGGAAYLATQARNAARVASSRLAAAEAVPGSGDQLFFLVPLQFLAQGAVTVRETPGPSGKPSFTLEPGAPVRGYSYAQRWVYIRDDRNRSGWVAYSQLGRP